MEAEVFVVWSSYEGSANGAIRLPRLEVRINRLVPAPDLCDVGLLQHYRGMVATRMA